MPLTPDPCSSHHSDPKLHRHSVVPVQLKTKPWPRCFVTWPGIGLQFACHVGVCEPQITQIIVRFRLNRFEDFPPNSLHQRNQQTMWQHNESVNQRNQSNMVAKIMQEIDKNRKPDPEHFKEKSPRQSLCLGSRNYDKSRRLQHWDALGLFKILTRLNHIKSVAFWGPDQCQAKVTEETVLVLSAQAVLQRVKCNPDISWKPCDGHDWAMMTTPTETLRGNHLNAGHLLQR